MQKPVREDEGDHLEVGAMAGSLLQHYRRNVKTDIELQEMATAEEVLRTAVDALKSYGFVASASAYLLEGGALRCIASTEAPADIPLHQMIELPVRALREGLVSIVRDDGSVELAGAVGGVPGATGAIAATLGKSSEDGWLLVKHLIQAASQRLRLLGLAKEAEPGDQELLKLQQEAALGSLLGAVLHEVCNSLAALMAHLEILSSKRGDDPVVAEHLSVLIPQLSRLTQIVDRARSLTRPKDDETDPVDVCDTLRAAVSLVEYHYRTYNVTCALDCSEDVPPILGNANRLQQAWINYFNNAFEAIRRKDIVDGRIRIRVRLQFQLCRVTVEIADNGVGMDEEMVQLANSAADRQAQASRRLGLGLREAARVIAEHRGSVQISSTVGKGTTVRAAFPASCFSPEGR
jgi:signal transduction histidine kinase